MKSCIIYSLFILGLSVGAAHAGDTREVELTDGSVVSAEIVSVHDGVYTLKSGSLGTIKVEESKIRAIRMKSPETPAAPGKERTGGAPAAEQVKSLRDKMTGSQEIMDMVRDLRNDPDFQKIMEDPDVIKAVDSGDIDTLLANPLFMKLLNNSTVKEIQKKVGK